MSKRLRIIVLGLLCVSFVLLANLNYVSAQDAQGEQCLLQNNGCSQQGIQLTTLLENRGLSFSLIVIAGLLDGVNPCAIGMLILLLGYLMVFAKEPRRMIRIGLIYIATIFITYFLIGVVFSHIVYGLLEWPLYQQVSHIIKYVIVALIWLAALVNLKDVFYYGKGFTLGVSQGEVPILMKLIKKVTWPATILLGMTVTIFELPCSLPLYVGSIALMTSTFHYAKTLLFLFVYNLMFIVPLIVVFAAIVKTHHIFEAKDAQERFNRWMKLSMSIAQIIIGIILLFL